MTSREYIEQAMRTHHGEYTFEGSEDVPPQLEHALWGITSESGEMADLIKKAKIHGKTLDTVELIGEAGDMMWYFALFCDALDISFEDLWDKNIRKLQARFPEGYDNQEMLEKTNRSGEREELEK
jgi:NTP pyrophosphatase (non-canonical NTP hydrolase)